MLARFMCGALVVLFPFAALADELTPQKRTDIRRLLDVTGSAAIAVQFAGTVTSNLASALRAARPEVPDRVFVVIEREVLVVFQEKLTEPGGLFDRVIPLYARYFTHAEICELLAFY